MSAPTARDRGILLDAIGLVERALVASRSGDSGLRGLPEAARPLQADKVRCEAAMLLRAAAPPAEREPGLRAALSGLATELTATQADAFAVRLCLQPGIALDLALVPLHLRALGLGDPRLEPLLSDLLGGDRMPGPERPPHRVLEQLWLHELWSGTRDSASVQRALAASSPAWELDHLAGTTEDAYAFTHAILYATDHGRRPIALPRAAGDIVGDADALLAVALDAGNHDVAAEVLWTWPMLDLPWTPLAAQARSFLAQVSAEHGFLPGPEFDPAVHERLPGALRDAYVLRTSYHTTLVHGLLLAAGPGRAEANPRSAPGVADTVATVVGPSVRSEVWWDHVAALPVAARDALAPAMVTMGLRRAATAADLGAVQHTLEVAAACGLPVTPVIRQARILLRRAMSCAELARSAR